MKSSHWQLYKTDPSPIVFDIVDDRPKPRWTGFDVCIALFVGILMGFVPGMKYALDATVQATIWKTKAQSWQKLNDGYDKALSVCERHCVPKMYNQ